MTNRAKSYAYEFFLFGIIFSKMVDILMGDFSFPPLGIGVVLLLIYSFFLIKKRARLNEA